MSFEAARRALDMGHIAVTALETIQSWSKIGGDRAAEALAAVDAAITALRDGFGGAAKPDDVIARIDALHASLHDNDAAADSALDAKFDKGGAS